MTRAIVALLLFVTACTIPQTSEKKEDSVAMLPGDTLELASDEVSPADTVYNPLNLGGRFDEPQVSSDIVYVYAINGLDVFDTNVASNSIGHVDYKTKLRLLGAMRGEYTAIDFQGKTGYVESGYLLTLPVPETTDVIEYFTNTLMLMEDPVERTHPKSFEGTDATFLIVNYNFENGFKIYKHEYYEGGGVEVTLSGFTMKQAFLFASYFYDDFRNNFEEFPEVEIDKANEDGSYIKVHLENGGVESILVGEGEGCSWEQSIMTIPGGCMMASGGGC